MSYLWHQLFADSEDEEEKERAEKRRRLAQRHWTIIRRDVNDRIRKRKENNTADKCWNILRHQVRAATRAQTVRHELYAKYGVAKPYNKIQPIEKPTISDEVKQLITTFEALEIKKISHSYIDSKDNSLLRHSALQSNKSAVSLRN